MPLDFYFEAGKPYGSQVAESPVDARIHGSHQRKRKMQFPRAGAHHGLQIRAKLAGEAWEEKWEDTVMAALKGVLSQEI